MKFSLHGGSAEEEMALKGFAERLGAGFVRYEGMPEEEPMLVVQCLPRRMGLIDAINQVTQWLDGGPLSRGETGGAVQDPLPGLETPPCP